jgi:histidinol-phosphate aminotransferase
MSDILDLMRADLRDYPGYASARRDDVRGSVWLNANEAPAPSPADASGCLHRYPEPQPRALRERMAWLYGVAPDRLLVTRGSDEGIDLLVRAFCRAGHDGVLVAPPCFGMYAACARIQGAPLVLAPLRERDAGWQLDLPDVVRAVDQHRVRVVFLCSPANPTGQALTLAQVETLAEALRERCLLVVDEAYVEFSAIPSASALLARFPGLVVLRTLSKAHALAGARIGAVLADPAVVRLLANLLAPYPVPAPSAALAMAALTDAALAMARERVARSVGARQALAQALAACPDVRRVYASEGNYLLVRCADAGAVLDRLLAHGVVVRDMRAFAQLADALRISVGSEQDNARLLEVLASGAAP